MVHILSYLRSTIGKGMTLFKDYMIADPEDAKAVSYWYLPAQFFSCLTVMQFLQVFFRVAYMNGQESFKHENKKIYGPDKEISKVFELETNTIFYKRPDIR